MQRRTRVGVCVVAVGVDEQVRLRADADAVIARRRVSRSRPLPSSLDAVEILHRDGRRACRRSRPSRVSSTTVQRPHFPVAARDLPFQLAVRREVIEVSPTGALAGKQERAVLEERRRAGVIDPGFRRLAEEPRRSRRRRAARCRSRARSGRGPARRSRHSGCRASSRRASTARRSAE